MVSSSTLMVDSWYPICAIHCDMPCNMVACVCHECARYQRHFIGWFEIQYSRILALTYQWFEVKKRWSKSIDRMRIYALVLYVVAVMKKAVESRFVWLWMIWIECDRWRKDMETLDTRIIEIGKWKSLWNYLRVWRWVFMFVYNALCALS